MKYLIAFCIISVSLFSCGDKKNIPDVSNIKIDVQVQHFEKDFFALDTTHLQEGLQKLAIKYPQFASDFFSNILGLQKLDDSSAVYIKGFYASYKPMLQTTEQLFGDFSKYEKDIKQSFQFVKYYFPNYQLPHKIITFIGPMDAYFNGSISSYGDVMTQAGPAIGLQLHLGANAPEYNVGLQSGQVFLYQTARFTPATIPVNTIKNIIDDLFPYKAEGRPLIEEMIEKGKRLYVLDKLMPYTNDTLKIGYTKSQLDGCRQHEASIWNFFVQNNLLFSIEPSMNKDYIADGPKTQALGEASPGYIGLFVGWQIINNWMAKNNKTTLDQLMQKDAKELFNEVGYKPKGD